MTKVLFPITVAFLLAILTICSNPSDEQGQDEVRSWIGMLAIVTEETCGIPEGCAPYITLWDESFERYIPLEGNIDERDSELIVRVAGTRPGNPVLVNSYEKLSRIKYHDFLARAAGDYFEDHYSCLIEYQNDTVFTKWNKTFGWGLQEDKPILKVRMTDTTSTERPQPYIELRFDGLEGSFVRESKSLPSLEPCS